MALQEATRNWTEELAVAGTRISKSSSRLQSAFSSASNKALHAGDEAIPDPIKLIHRVVALELAMKRIQKDCRELAEKRKQVALEVMERQQKSVDALRQLEERLTTLGNRQEFPKPMNTAKDKEQHEEWKRLADQLADQIGVFDNEKRTKNCAS